MHYGEAFKSRQWCWASHEPARIEQGLRTFAKLLPFHISIGQLPELPGSDFRDDHRNSEPSPTRCGRREIRPSPTIAIAFCTRVLDDD